MDIHHDYSPPHHRQVVDDTDTDDGDGDYSGDDEKNEYEDYQNHGCYDEDHHHEHHLQ